MSDDRRILDKTLDLDIDQDTRFLVSTVRLAPRLTDESINTPTVDILGLFSSIDEALACADAHRIMDTTILDRPMITPILPTNLKNYEIVFKLFFVEDKLHIQSRLCDPQIELYVTENDEFFEALIEPKDINIFIERARMWHGDIIGGEFIIVDQVPDEAIDMTQLLDS